MEQEGERDSSSSWFSGLSRSVSVAEWTVPVFVPVPVSRCHPEARRHCFRIERRRSGLLPRLLAFSLPTSPPSRQRGAGREQEVRLQTEPVTPKPIRDTVRQTCCWAGALFASGSACRYKHIQTQLTRTCTRPPFVIQQGDSRFFS